MCGIAGYVGDPLPANAYHAVVRMTAALERRGPDAQGVENWPAAVLGHRRLSIFDLTEAGSQPMLSRDKQIGLVFNGAIYNFLELRIELERAGYCFRSESDTEVLVYGYQHWGIDDLVGKLRGMFAFAIWDNRRRALMLVRDRLGVKPIVYRVANGSIAFASTIGALHCAGMLQEVDESAVLDFLEWGWIPDHRAIFKGVVKIPAATIVEWQAGRITQRRYWKVPEPSRGKRIRFDDAVAQTEELVLDAVRIRLAADVPVGALLSGGIDSTLVCWAMSHLKANIRAFTIRTGSYESDETADASYTARVLGIPHHVIDLPSQKSAPTDQLISAYGEPFACASAIGMLRLSEAIKPQATVLLTGDGGDDIFLGYPRHRHMWYAQKLANVLPESIAGKWPWARRQLQRWPQLRRPVHFLDYATEGLSAAASNSDLLNYYHRNNFIGARVQNAIDLRVAPTPSFSSARRLLPEFLEHEWQTQFTGEYMTKVDGASMFHAIEARSPLLDHVLWEHAASLPYDLRLHRGELKAVLRQIVRNRVGARTASRRKRGFTIPVEHWLSQHWRQDLQRLSEDSLLERGQWIRPQAIRRAVDETVTSGRVPKQLWYLMVLEQWMRRYSGASSSAASEWRSGSLTKAHAAQS
jgi:asparagine synthase (glutamine-hydrolysing)